jgi:hypothetical protein
MHLPLLVVLPQHEQRASESPAVAASAILEAAVVGEGAPEAAPASGLVILSAALSEPLLADRDRGEEA